MPTKRFVIQNASDGTISKYPPRLSALDLLQENNDSFYVFMNNGFSEDPAYGTLAFSFGADFISNSIGSSSKIKSCKFGIYSAVYDDPNWNWSQATILLNYTPLLIAYNIGINTFVETTNVLRTNPNTNTGWTIRDFDEDMILKLETNGPYGIRVSYIYLDIEYIEHEVFETPLGKIKEKTSIGIIELPFFKPSEISYPALRISSSKGVGAFCLVDIGNKYASPIRVKTPKGIKSIAYIK